MFKKYFILVLSAGLVYLSACQKDIDYFIPDSGLNSPDTTWASIITDSMPVSELKESLLIDKSADSVNLTAPMDFTTGAGLQLSLNPASLLTASGMPVSGSIFIESGLYTTKGQLIRMNITAASDVGLLSTSGVIYLNIKQNNQLLSVSQGSVFSLKYSPASVTGGLNIYNAQQPQTGSGFYWLYNYDTLLNKVISSANLYQVNTENFGWLNAGAGIPHGAGSVTVKLPVNYTNKNSTVWLALNNKNTAINFVPYIDERSFIMGSLPENTSAKIIVMSKQAGNYYFAQQDITITATGHLNPVFMSPVISTLDNIKGYLNSL